MAISFISQATNTGTTITIPSAQVGDLLLMFAYRTAVTAPTVPTGWTSITSGTGDVNACVIGYRWAQGSDTSGTWANATQLVCHVYRGVAGIGASTTHDTTTSPASIAAITLGITDGTSWVVGFCGSKQGTSQSTPGTLDNRSELKNSTTSMVDGYDTNGGVSSWSAASVTLGSSTDSFTATVELEASKVSFLEAGGDSTFDLSIWPNASTPAPTVVSDIVHGGHLRSIKAAPSATQYLLASNKAGKAGGRVSAWFYWNVLPSTTISFMGLELTGDGNEVNSLQISNTGVLGLNVTGGTGGSIAAGAWHRITFDWMITSTTVNVFKIFLDGALVITATNQTLTQVNAADIYFGNINGDVAMDLRISDVYIDNLTALTDPGNIWVTAKRPFSNGTTNGFTTQIGSSGSGYGTGHAPQVNERALSTADGWSMVGAGSAVTEEYSIEGQGVGDLSTVGGTIVDFMGWVDASSLASETASIIIGGASSNISLTSAITIFTKIAGSTTYPAGGTDIGIVTTTALTTVSLYEAGIIVAYIPAVVGGTPNYVSSITLLGVG